MVAGGQCEEVSELDGKVVVAGVNVVRRYQLAPVGGECGKAFLVSGEAKARLNNKQVGCQAGAQSEEGALDPPTADR